MWTITISDLRYRASRFAVAVIGAAVVFALALLLSGLAYSFRLEIHTTVDDAHAERWIVPEDSPGPLASVKVTSEDIGDELGEADPLLSLPTSVVLKGEARASTVIGHEFGGLGTPTVIEGRNASAPDEAVVDAHMDAEVGDVVNVGLLELKVVGMTRDHRMFGGQPNLYADLRQVQVGLLAGAPVVTSFLTSDVPESVPDGMKAMTNEEVYADSVRVLGSALDSVDTNRLLMWGVAVLIIAALIYITALERTRDFAVLKAMGARSALPLSSLVAQAVIVTLLAGVVSFGLARLLKPMFPLPIQVPFYAYRDLLLVAVVVGALAGLAGARRAVTVEPTLAFAGA